MKAEYYPKNQIWIVRVEDKEIKFPIEMVTVELIEYFAKLYDKIGKDIGWEMLSETDKKELLDWFESDVFPSKEFGEFLINEIHKEALEVLKSEEEMKVSSSIDFSTLLSGLRESYLKSLSNSFLNVESELDKIIREDISYEKALEEIITEYDEKGELDSRLEALSSYDTYAVEDLMRTLQKKGVNTENLELSRIINDIRKLLLRRMI